MIADDGSGPETKKVVEDFQKIFPVPLIHAWQKDLGFRLAASRNNACKLSSGDYLIFLDGDCIPKKDFVEKHRKLADACAPLSDIFTRFRESSNEIGHKQFF